MFAVVMPANRRSYSTRKALFARLPDFEGGRRNTDKKKQRSTHSAMPLTPSRSKLSTFRLRFLQKLEILRSSDN